MKWQRCFQIAGGLVILLASFATFSQPAANIHVEAGLIKITTSSYEIAFSMTNGAVAYIRDAATQQNISDGSRDNALWAATFDNDKQIDAGTYAGTFAYSIDANKSQLTLSYSGNTVAVTVLIDAADSQSLKMQAAVTNNSGHPIVMVGFPNGLKVSDSAVQDALLPMMPGALLGAHFFSKSGTYIGEYPGEMFADYLALRSTQGKLALYSQRGAEFQPTYLGYEHLSSDPTETAMTHTYKTWITTSWSSPWVSLRIGQDYPATIAGYRTDNGIDQYQSLSSKLGSAAQAYFAAPMYKLDVQALNLGFNDLKSAVVDHMNFPGLIHMVAFQTGGHDHNYPDFIPPATKWGTTDDFASLVQSMQSKGSLVVPYTNFSWWDIKGPTLTKLPSGTTLKDVIVKDANGIADLETYTGRGGFVVDLNNAFVQNKIDQEYDALVKTVGVNGIFEDQWGSRDAPYDFNAAGLKTYSPASAYFEGVLTHFGEQAPSHLFTEVGVDVLAQDAVGFMGTTYLWDMLGYRGATAADTTYYPMAGMLLRDKVMLYQHNLAAETWTKNKDMLRWNLAEGYNLSNAFLDDALPGLNMDNPWLNLVGVFQKYALANYVDQPVLSYDDLGGDVKRTVFSSYQVTSNWSSDTPYTINGAILPPGGVVTQADDGSVTAGVFTSYNGQPLSTGDHYLVEVRATDASIKVFQPVGADTPLAINAPAQAKVAAYRYDDTLIAPVDATVNNGEVSFTYARTVNGQAVGYYKISG